MFLLRNTSILSLSEYTSIFIFPPCSTICWWESFVVFVFSLWIYDLCEQFETKKYILVLPVLWQMKVEQLKYPAIVQQWNHFFVSRIASWRSYLFTQLTKRINHNCIDGSESRSFLFFFDISKSGDKKVCPMYPYAYVRPSCFPLRIFSFKIQSACWKDVNYRRLH